MDKVLRRLESMGFEIRKTAKEVLIINPSDPDTGTAVLNPSDGYLSWERTEWSHWGPFENLDDDQEAQLVTDTIAGFLGTVRHLTGSSSQQTPGPAL